VLLFVVFAAVFAVFLSPFSTHDAIAIIHAIIHPSTKIYYHYLAIELREICRKRGIPYIQLDSFPAALASFQRHVYQMGRMPQEKNISGAKKKAV